jgi:hypothetical protein
MRVSFIHKKGSISNKLFERGVYYIFHLLLCGSRSKNFVMNYKNKYQFSYTEYEKKKSQAKELISVLHIFQITLRSK